jgi:N4-(beta-N-acetylglucosaminyl)-L-asparaginase
MSTRREFLIGAGAGLAALGSTNLVKAATGDDAPKYNREKKPRPMVISTWNHGVASNARAWDLIARGWSALDAVERGVHVAEGDPNIRSVGYGGLPDREGHVTLDSCIMDWRGNAGSVAFLEGIKHPVSVARKVMEDTPHVMLVGEGAKQFALDNDFKDEDLLTDEARLQWQKWLEKSDYKPWSGPNEPDPSHDTIGMLALDTKGRLSGSCTTSGLGFKMHGRVGDSPIIGAALFVDNKVGAACATGVGEEVMKTVGSFLIVELMRQGLSPQEACRTAVGRIVENNPDWRNIQVGYLALDNRGNYGAFALQKGFQFAIQNSTESDLVDAPYWIDG